MSTVNLISPCHKIRNFSIIAHVDHGKSTLADRFIQMCGGLESREMKAQVLDSMEIERERGITIKAQCVTLTYEAKNGELYTLNFIDTPGHVDFSYEVSRSLKACEGALLVVDAAQGVEAQTVANCYTAIDLGLTVLPVLNKIDLPAADPERVINEIEEVIGIGAQDALGVSAKTGDGVIEVLEAIIKKLPPPTGDPNAPLSALVIDSWFDNYLGVVALVRVFDGVLNSAKAKVKFMSTLEEHQVDKVGIFTPKPVNLEKLEPGAVGFIIAGLKTISSARVGDTITDSQNPTKQALKGFQDIQPKVFAGLYPINNSEFEAFRVALEKLKLNDSSLSYTPESSQALGTGFRCGFLGMLHMEIVQERLEREYGLNLITTAPTVIYDILLKNGDKVTISNPASLPNLSKVDMIYEPMIEARILVPHEYVGSIITLCVDRRGIQKNMHYLGRQVMIVFEMPLNEVILDFFDRLKSVSRGYASWDYALIEKCEANMCRVDILINKERVDSLAILVHKDKSQRRARLMVHKLRGLIPRQMFDISIQGAIGSKIIARETVKALRKNVTAKCYGGDITRKRKLLEKQKEGKKRMKQVGMVEMPQEAFLSILKIEND